MNEETSTQETGAPTEAEAVPSIPTLVISLGGSLIIKDQIDTAFLANFRKLIIETTRYRFLIVCGGGSVNTRYNEAIKQISKPADKDLDRIGIRCTKLNAELVRVLFSDVAYESVVEAPTKRVDTDKRIIICSGWKPGFSSDKASVHYAKKFKAEKVINMTNVDYVYTGDPKKDTEAQPLTTITWGGYIAIVGTRWKPRMHTPFDPKASSLARKLGLKVIIINGEKLDNVRACLEGKEFVGTTIG